MKRIKDSDVQLVTTLHRTLNPANQRFVSLIVNQTLDSNEMGGEILLKINDLNVTRTIIRQLKPVVQIRPDCMKIICELFNKRDDRICQSHKDVNQDSQYYQEFRPSFFYPTEFMESLILDPTSDIDFQIMRRENVVLSNAHRLFFTYQNDELTDSWCLLVVDITIRKIYYIDPKLNLAELLPHDIRLEILLEKFEIALNPFLSSVINTFEGNWQCDVFPDAMFVPLQNDFDSGIYLAAIMYFIVQDCPPTFLESNVNKFRSSFAYWILNEALPI